MSGFGRIRDIAWDGGHILKVLFSDISNGNARHLVQHDFLHCAI